jgi:hypothetical protein
MTKLCPKWAYFLTVSINKKSKKILQVFLWTVKKFHNFSVHQKFPSISRPLQIDPNLVFLGVQILLSTRLYRHFYKEKKSGRFWPNAQVYLAECRPANLPIIAKVLNALCKLNH